MNYPKINLIYYKNIIDQSCIHFFDEYNDFFIKQDDSYILASNFDINKLEKIFKKYIKLELKKYVKPYDILNLNYYFIIGSCLPKDNILLKYKNDKYFPQKLNKLINSNYNIKYYLKEKDIKLDLVKFNTLFINIYNYLFKENNLNKFLGSNYNNVFLIQHNNLDCYGMFKIIKYIYGKDNCVNLYKEHLEDKKSILVAVNDKINEYINNKTELNKSKEFKNIIQEVKMYLEFCLNGKE